MPNLFVPFSLGAVELKNRILMAPMTRDETMRSDGAPDETTARYYAQRASAGLIITQATYVSPQGQGASSTPGIHSRAQVEGWRQVTDAVHAAGGRIFLQLDHAGRLSEAGLHDDGKPVAPSAVSPRALTLATDRAIGRIATVDCSTPRALATEEVVDVVDDFRRAAERALEARFDGVEIHGAHGHLVDQFLRRSSNRRTDRYGGSATNRVRFLTEVAEAVSGVFGRDRTGVRLSPFLTQHGMQDPEILQTTLIAAEALEEIKLAYIHIAEADAGQSPGTPLSFRRRLRLALSGRIVVAGNYNLQRAQSVVWDCHADAVAFGRSFAVNPDLPRRFEDGLPLAPYDPRQLTANDGRKPWTDQPFESYAIA